jgi:hypothetical protein
VYVSSRDPLDPTPTVELAPERRADLHDAYHRLLEVQGRLNDPLGRAPLVVDVDAPHPEGNRAHRRGHRLK